MSNQSQVRPAAPGPAAAPVDLEGGIAEVLSRTSRKLNLDVAKMATVGHLRRTARDIALNLFGVQTETAEVVALQNAFERSLNAFCEATSSPSAAAAYVAPDTARALQAAQSNAAKVAPADVAATDEVVGD